MAKRAIIKAIKNYLQLLEEQGISIEKAYLFGSYSKNKETEDSDIDLLIVSNQFDLRDDYLIGKIWALTRKINSKIEPYIVTTEGFYADEVSPLIQIVKQEGIEIT